MPDCVAHYQFGLELLDRLDAKLKSAALAYKREYEMGLQGPDIFFFYKPYRKTNPVMDYGMACHNRPASHMFIPILKQVREKSALSYMMGLICHYTLDAYCHAYVNKHSKDLADHNRMEAAYDRHILSRSSYGRPRYSLTHTSGLDVNAMASLWRGMNANVIRECIKSKRFYTWLLDRKGTLLALETFAGKRGVLSPLFLPDAVSPEQREHAQRLDELYGQALEETPRRIRLACEVMGTAVQRLEGFEMNYEGEIPHEQAEEKLDLL